MYLTGLDHDGTSRDPSSAILRGRLQLNITKSVKIKTVTLTFTGKARTEWPEGKSLLRNTDRFHIMTTLTDFRYSTTKGATV